MSVSRYQLDVLDGLREGLLLQQRAAFGGWAFYSDGRWVRGVRAPTVEALSDRGVLVIEHPRTTPGIYDTRARLVEAPPAPRRRRRSA